MKHVVIRLITTLGLYLTSLSLFFAHSSENISIKEKVAAATPTFTISSNIAYQKEYDKRWAFIFQKANCISEETLGQMTRELMLSKDFYKNNPFFIGFSSSGYQFEGGIADECSWHDFALRNGLTVPGEGCGFWENYEAMIKEMKEVGHINAFRMSPEWSRIEPSKGQYNQDAILHYRKIFQCLKDNNIEVLCVLNHYTVPTWFEKMGDFEFSENIHHFVEFTQKAYLSFYDLVTYWSTCNAPEGIAFKGRYTLTGAPGREKSLQKTMLVMQNILESHVQFYEAVKGNPLKGTTGLWQKLQAQSPSTIIHEPMIGIQKNVMPFDIAYDTSLHYLASPLTSICNKIAESLTNDSFYSFFTNGRFFSKSIIPWTNINHVNKMAPYSLDWIGINHHSNKKRFLLSDVPDTDIRQTTRNENYRFYPQGLYRATCEMSTKLLKPLALKTGRKIPMWITENGIAAIDDEQRADFNKKIMVVLYKLIKEDFPIIGYTQWASHDNWEWGAKPGTKRYGSFFVDFNDIYGPHPLKVGAKGLTEFIKAVVA